MLTHPTPHTVLVVEDDADSGEMLVQFLAMWGHASELTADGPSALAAADARHPEVVLLDLGLPGMDGLEVARRLRKSPATRGSYIVALSGRATAEDQTETRAAGFDAHLVKPVEIDDLEKLLSARFAPRT